MIASFQERIVSLARDGKPPREIYRVLNGCIDVADITRVICQARNDGADIPYFHAPNAWSGERATVVFAVETLERLVPHAHRRKISVADLVRRVIDATLDGNLVDAVLDDGDAA
jgi:hypothetical protein